MSLQQHEIAEASRRILNPFTAQKLEVLGSVCGASAGQRLLDLACGKGELLSTWAARYGITGLGIDLSPVFLAAAGQRAAELGVSATVTFQQGDAGAFEPAPGTWDIASCIGATWIRGGLAGTAELLHRAVHPDGVVLIGEPFWLGDPSPEAAAALGCTPDEYTTLVGTADRLAAAGLELVEMVLADRDSWDRYVAGQWWTVDQWLRANPDDPRARGMHDYLDASRRAYLGYGRELFGWGVFVTRPARRPVGAADCEDPR